MAKAKDKLNKCLIYLHTIQVTQALAEISQTCKPIIATAHAMTSFPCLPGNYPWQQSPNTTSIPPSPQFPHFEKASSYQLPTNVLPVPILNHLSISEIPKFLSMLIIFGPPTANLPNLSKGKGVQDGTFLSKKILQRLAFCSLSGAPQ